MAIKDILVHLTDGDECGEGVADDGEAKGSEKLMGAGGHLEWQRDHISPGILAFAQFSSQGAVGENGNREGSIFSVSADDGSGQVSGFGVTDLFG